MANSKILTPEDKMKLRQPIDEYVGKIQKQIDVLRKDGTAKVLEYQNIIDGIKRDRTLTKGERENRISQCQVELEKAKAVESKNKDEISKLIADAENYLKAHFDKEYYTPIKESCAAEKVQAKERYKERLAELERQHKEILSGLKEQKEIKDENYVYKNRLANAKLELQKEYQGIKDERHEGQHC